MKKLEKEKTYTIDLNKEFAVLFLTDGKISIDAQSNKDYIQNKNEFSLLTHFFSYEITAKLNSTLTILFFDRSSSRCDLLSFEKMIGEINTKDEFKFRKLKMNKPLMNFTEHMRFYTDKKMYCRHLHDIKENEFFFLIYGAYTKEEIAYFFTPVIRAMNDFTNIVRTNYLKVKTVNELAEICNMTTKTFTRRFKETFNETPKRWMMREKSKYNSLNRKYSD